MRVTLRFAVEGLAAGHRVAPADRTAAVVAALEESGFEARFDSKRRLFSVIFESGQRSFAQVRKAVAEAGRRQRRVYIANLMSP